MEVKSMCQKSVQEDKLAVGMCIICRGWLLATVHSKSSKLNVDSI
jgi:hypothetical protein